MKIIKIGGTALFSKKDLVTFVANSKTYESPALYVISAFDKLSSELKYFIENILINDDLSYPMSKFTELFDLLDSKQCKIFTHFLENVSININRLVLGARKTNEIPPLIVDEILSYGEIVSSFFIHCLFLSNGIESNFIDARSLITTNNSFGKATPELDISKSKILDNINKNRITITQGFIGADKQGRTTTMGFESSNLSAMIFAEALQSSEIEIIMKVTQIYSYDPEVLSNARPVNRIPYESAKLLSKYNFKLIYPGMIDIAIKNDIILGYTGLYSKSCSVISNSSEFGMSVVLEYKGSILITPISKKNSITLVSKYVDDLVKYSYDSSNFSLTLELKSSNPKKIHNDIISLF